DGTSAEVVGRLREVLHEPRTALPHDDHLHLRVYCSQRDVSGGCVNNGKMRPWVDGYEDDRLACIERFAQLAAHDEAAPQRAAAMGRRGVLAATQRSQTVVAARGEGDGEVRLGATEVLGRLGGRGAVDALVARDTKE